MLRYVVRAIAIVCVLSVTACASAPSSSRVTQTRVLPFPSEVPARGAFKVKGKVSNIVACPRGAYCLIANHLVVVSLNSRSNYDKARGLLVFPKDVGIFKKGKAYEFTFMNGRYVSARDL